MPAPAHAARLAAGKVIAMLDALGADLAAAGWTTRLTIAPGHAPALFVQNPEPGAEALAETIYAAPCRDGGEPCFWWSWAEPVTGHAGQAAAVIRRALRAAPEITGTGTGAP